jgi:hypothetical protein
MILFGASVSAKQAQTKLLKFHGYNIIMIDRWSPTFKWVILEEAGEMTHVGRYHCEGAGVVGPSGIMGSGTLTTASGDTLLWKATGSTVELTGLTGRFTGAVGSFEATRTVTNMEFSPDGRYQTVTYSQYGVGTITY